MEDDPSVVPVGFVREGRLVRDYDYASLWTGTTTLYLYLPYPVVCTLDHPPELDCHLFAYRKLLCLQHATPSYPVIKLPDPVVVGILVVVMFYSDHTSMTECK